MAHEQIVDWLLEVARRDGAEYPTFAESTDEIGIYKTLAAAQRAAEREVRP
jgi:hypothetical protein